MNKAKNAFVKWLKENNADNIDGLDTQPSNDEWDYYRIISGFINDNFYCVMFMVCEGRENIRYKDDENGYNKMSIDEFMQFIE